MLIDLRPGFTAVRVDGDLVRLGAGALWGEVAAALAPHGLGLTSGDTKSVGVGGLVLGGGIGWMVRQHGLTIGNLVGATVVLPSGEIVEASETAHPDLFWALRGGGGNFGVVTEFAFRAHRVDGVVFGALQYDPSALGDVLRGWRDVMRESPEELNSTVGAMPGFGPEMPASLSIWVCLPGRDAAAAAPALERLRALPGHRSDDIRVVDYADALEDPQEFDGPPPTIVGTNGFSAELGDEVIGAAVAAHQRVGGILMVRYLAGAMNRVPVDATAWAARDVEAFFVIAGFLPPGADPSAAHGMREAWSPLSDRTIGLYGNFADGTGSKILERMYPPAMLERLREVKRRYDPQNLLRWNHNLG